MEVASPEQTSSTMTAADGTGVEGAGGFRRRSGLQNPVSGSVRQPGDPSRDRSSGSATSGVRAMPPGNVRIERSCTRRSLQILSLGFGTARRRFSDRNGPVRAARRASRVAEAARAARGAARASGFARRRPLRAPAISPIRRLSRSPGSGEGEGSFAGRSRRPSPNARHEQVEEDNARCRAGQQVIDGCASVVRLRDVVSLVDESGLSAARWSASSSTRRMRGPPECSRSPGDTPLQRGGESGRSCPWTLAPLSTNDFTPMRRRLVQDWQRAVANRELGSRM